jgi:pimeloyl-CoA dehydrogenase small subunit
MDFNFTDDQRLLRDSVERLLADNYDFAQRKAGLLEPGGWSRRQWHRFAEMGLLGLPFAESDGGFGGGLPEILIVMEAFGKALVVEPYLPTVLLGGGFVHEGGSAEQRAAIIPRIVAGELTLAFAQAERQSRFDLANVETRARRNGTGWVLDGHKKHVLGGANADVLVVSARVSGDTRDLDGLALFLIDAKAPGVRRRGYPLQDQTCAAEIRFEGVHVGGDALIGEAGNALPLMTRVVNRAIAALCCEAVGVMDDVHRRTIEYMKVRKQFGAAIGSFQALRHRAVDMYVEVELARSIAMFGMMSCQDPDLAVGSHAVSTTKVQIGRAARHVGQEAIQLHGGIGMTEEYPAGSYFRRLSMIEVQFGDTRHHLEAVVADGAVAEAAA